MNGKSQKSSKRVRIVRLTLAMPVHGVRNASIQMASIHDAIMGDVEEFALLLLNDDHGINEAAYEHLCVLAVRFKSEKLAKLTKAVKATDGRYYLPERSA